MLKRDVPLKLLGLLSQQVTEEPALSVKQEIIRGFLSRYDGDLEVLLRLLLPKYANRIYYVQEKQLLRVLSSVLNVSEDTLKATWNENGCVAETAQKYFRPTTHLDASGWCDMTLNTFDAYLDRMAAASNESARVVVVSDFLQHACGNAVYYFFREIKLDLRLGAGLRVVLGALHPNAYELFQHCASVQEVVRRVQGGETQSQSEEVLGAPPSDGSPTVTASTAILVQPTASPHYPTPTGAVPAVTTTTRAVARGSPSPPPAPEQRQRKLPSPSPTRGAVTQRQVKAEIKLGIPLAPMLAAPARSVDVVLSKCPNGAFSEVKYDGERIQIHKQGPTLHFFARSLRPMRPDKYEGLERYLASAIKADSCVLDGEILMVDLRTSLPLPFGTLGKHKKTQFASACPCVFLFDILYKDGASLLHVPLEERRETLKSAVTFVRNRVMFSELCLVRGTQEQRRAVLQQHLNRAIAEGLEGLVVKDVRSVYEPRARHWLKIKKDYLDGLADSADLLVLGAWYGSGNKGGQLSTFLMGCIDESVPAGLPGRYKTVCKVGNGLDDIAIGVLSQKYTQRMTPATAGVAPWLDCHSSHRPDMVLKDPTTADVMECIGAEFSVTKTHTSGVSIRFPRILRVRTDKTPDTATTLKELLQLFRTSKERLQEAGVEELEMVDSYAVLEPNEDSNAAPPTSPPPQSASPAAAVASTASVGGAPAAPVGGCAGCVQYTQGDATHPAVPAEANVVLCHSTAVGGQWSGRGFMGQVTAVFGPAAEQAYSQSVGRRGAGDVIVTEVGPASRAGRVYVATMMAQEPQTAKGQVPSVNQAGLHKCLAKCAEFAATQGASLHVVKPPDSTHVRWAEADHLLRQESAARGLSIVVYGTAPPPSSAPLESTAHNPQEGSSSAGRTPFTTPAEAKAATPAPAASPPLPPLPASTTPSAVPAPEAFTAPASGATTCPTLPIGWWSLLRKVRAQIITHDEEGCGETVKGLLAAYGGSAERVAGAPVAGRSSTHIILCEDVLKDEKKASAMCAAATKAHAGLVVTQTWLEECADACEVYAEALYHPSHRTVLAGCRLFFPSPVSSPAGKETAAPPDLARLASLLGGTVHTSWRMIGEARSTHCVCPAWCEEADKVFKLGGRVVSVRWLTDCAVVGRPLPERPYLLQPPSSSAAAASMSGGVGKSAAGNVLEGVLCGLAVYVGTDHYTRAVALAATTAVLRMGGRLCEKADEAQYCVLPRAVYEDEVVRSPALRFRCVDIAWLWSCLRKRTLQDPAQFIWHYITRAPKKDASTGGSSLPWATQNEEADTGDGDDRVSNSSYSTETYDERNGDSDADDAAKDAFAAEGDVKTEEETDDDTEVPGTKPSIA